LVHSLANVLDIERKASHLVLLHLAEVQLRGLYADYGFSSLFEMLVKKFNLSEASAYQRIRALELVREVPQVEVALKSGELNLSTVALAQRQIKNQEKVTGQKLARETKLEIVESIKNKTRVETERELMRLLPEAASCPKTHERRISVDATRLALNVSDRLMEKIKRLQELWAHVNPSMEYMELIERAVDQTLKRIDPALRTPKLSTRRLEESSKRCVKKAGLVRRPTYYSVEVDRELWQRADSQCEFIDARLGTRCTCKFGLEREHVIPIAKGGTNELSNLKLLCKAHNLLMARKHFGREKIANAIRANGRKTIG
jgi:5-methylcytosine-specific restriction endonuclease McrA